MTETELTRLLTAQQQAFRQNDAPDYKQRLVNLDKIIAMVRQNESRIVEAINQDYGNRSRFESTVADCLGVVSSAKYAKKHLKTWMQSRKVKTPLASRPGRAEIVPQPLGVIGIIGPWNYPFALIMQPLVAALAAGNRAMIKPSEITANTSALIAELIAEVFSEDEVAVVEGDAQVAAAFSALPFDHLFFTGSPEVGRQVAVAAAQNLTPVTLELGGKSPCIIDRDGGISENLAGVIFGKCFNAGQTCIAPDYLFVPTDQVDAFVEQSCTMARTFYPDLAANDEFTAMITDRHYQRMQALLDDARQKGAMVIEVNPAQEQDLAAVRKQPLTLILNATEEMRVLQEEIFGPLLPILPYDDVDDVIAYINARPRPLALYWFGKNKAERDRILARTISGGVTVNDTLMHFSHSNLPFGGVGTSGMGSYHAEFGFEAFSHHKPIYYRPAKNPSGRLHPPYGKKGDKIISLLRRFG